MPHPAARQHHGVSLHLRVQKGPPLMPVNKPCDVAAYYWPAYHDEPRWRRFMPDGEGEWETSLLDVVGRILKRQEIHTELHMEPALASVQSLAPQASQFVQAEFPESSFLTEERSFPPVQEAPGRSEQLFGANRSAGQLLGRAFDSATT